MSGDDARAGSLPGRVPGYLPGDALLAWYRRRGPVLRFGVGPQRYAVLLGPEANRFVFADSSRYRWREAFQALVPVDGPTSMIVSDGDDHRRRRALVTPALTPRRSAGHGEIVARRTDATVDGWRPGQVVDVYQELRAVIRRATVESLFGPVLARDADRLGADLQRLLDLVARLPATVDAHRCLRTPVWRRAMAARGRVDARIRAEVERVRRDRPDEDTVLARLVQGDLSDAEIRDQVITLIAAGYETTSATMAWVVYTALTTPGAWERARSEPAVVNALVHEALRLYPAAVVSARYVVEGFEFAGTRIRAGTTLMFSPYVTHRLPEVWPDPLTVRLDRWDPAARGYRRPGPAEFLPFGGGPHRCIGSSLAVMSLTTVIARVLARADLELLPQRVRPGGFAALRPWDGLQVRVREV